MDFLAGLNPRQREAVEFGEGPLLVLAGAGSGKTRVITHRIAHLITVHRVPGWAVLAVTFTNKAAGEMRSRVQALVPSDSSGGPLVSTFHSFCVRVLRREGAPLAEIRPRFTPSFTIYDDDDQTSILKSVYKNLGLDEKFMPYRAALSRISRAKSRKESPEDMAKAAADPIVSRLAKVYEDYEGRLLESNALDFDDLLLQTVRLLSHDSPLREKLQRRYEFLMVDEYQDTNRSQYELMRLLVGERANIAVVGDEDQSIYGWRGANIRNILDFEKDFPGAKIIRLEQNYRSTKNILDAASAVVAHNTERIGKWLWTESGAGEKIVFYQADDAENEALWIAHTTDAHLARDPDSHVAVLYRTNSQSRQIEEALRRYGRKYAVVGGFSFYQRAEIKDLLAYLKALVSPNDSISLLRIINTPARGIGRTTVEQIEQYARAHSLSVWEAVERMLEEKAFPPRAEAALTLFHGMMEKLSEGVTSQPAVELVRAVLVSTGYREMLENEGTPEAQNRIGNLDELLNAAADASQRGESLRDFLDHSALVSDADAVDERAPVSLLTMHNAKGLEFPVVFIAGLEEGLFPHSRSLLDSESAMEEERRLCYVAMTRAERRLYLSRALSRRRFGGGAAERTLPSRFLKEVPKELQQSIGPRQADRYTLDAPRGGVDLFAEQHAVRETASRNLYTGKTLNSVENVRRFFEDRKASAPVPAASSQARRPPAAPPVRQKKVGLGSTIDHPKFGRGTIMRLEGSGEDAKVTVSFPEHGLKKMVAKFAGIKIE
ncbi:MAG TPA: UvrD-helicase domain-containing protein [Bryobacteraceae bacterium]